MSSNGSFGGHSGRTSKELGINDEILCRIELLKSLQESFVCRRCGECCRRHEVIALTEDDILQAAQEKGFSKEKFIEEFDLRLRENPGNLDYYELPVGKNAACPFYSNHECTIYDARPRVCRGFPFLTSENVQNAFNMNDVIVLGGKCKAAIDHLDSIIGSVSEPMDEGIKKSDS